MALQQALGTLAGTHSNASYAYNELGNTAIGTETAVEASLWKSRWLSVDANNCIASHQTIILLGGIVRLGRATESSSDELVAWGKYDICRDFATGCVWVAGPLQQSSSSRVGAAKTQKWPG